MAQSTAAAPPKERNLGETGWFALPIEIFQAGLSANTVALYAWICLEADLGKNPPTSMLVPAKVMGVSVMDVKASFDELKERNMVVVNSPADWNLTAPENWTPAP